MNTERIQYLILGGGVTGLSFANFLAAGDWMLIEKESSVGGCCRTTYKDGFTWDRSGHFFHFRDDTVRDYLKSRMPPGTLLEITRQARIHYGNGWIDFPFQKNIHQLPREEFLDCLYDLYFAPADAPCDSFQDMVYARFGRSIAEKFLIPYNRKLYACDLNTLDADAMGRFFPRTNIGDVIRSFRSTDCPSYNSTFLYPKKGAIQLVDALTHDLDPRRIALGEEVIRIDPDEKLVETSRRRIRYERLISTLPFPNLLDLIHERGRRDCLTWSQVLVFNLGFDAKGPTGVHWIYFPESQYRFYRVGFYDNLLGTDRMSLYVEIGLEKGQHADLGREREAVLAGLRTAGIVREQTLLGSEELVLDPGYVHITKESRSFFDKMDRSLRSLGVYSIGRYGGWKYCSIEDNIIEARSLAEDFNQTRATSPRDACDA
jgi:protoporphyrinogen oxidase